MYPLSLSLPLRRRVRRSRLVDLGLKIAAGIRDGLGMLYRYDLLASKADPELARIALTREACRRAVADRR